MRYINNLAKKREKVSIGITYFILIFLGASRGSIYINNLSNFKVFSILKVLFIADNAKLLLIN